MVLNIKWDDNVLVEFTKKGDLYFAKMNFDSIDKLKQNPLIVTMFSKIPLVSSGIPKFILNRIPPKRLRNKMLEINNLSEEELNLKYIQKYECKYLTDKISVQTQ